MQRLVARFLLLTTVGGLLAPFALAIPRSTPSCCLRKPMHPCHGGMMGMTSSEDSDHSFKAGAQCCPDHRCCRSVAISQKAQPRPFAAAQTIEQADAVVPDLAPEFHSSDSFVFHPVRAPPVL